MDKFSASLKPIICLIVLGPTLVSLEHAVKIALKVFSALYSAEKFQNLSFL